jgi:hypothetical protein
MAVIHGGCFGPLVTAGQPAFNFSFTKSVQFNTTMKFSTPNQTLIRATLCASIVLYSPVAVAAEPSPWLGSDEQAPFQLDPNTMVAVTFAADPLHTGSTTKAPCDLAGCTLPPKTAITPPADSGSPQN